MAKELTPSADGFRPRAIWDANFPDWQRGPLKERCDWAEENIGLVNDIIRIEFFLIDVPFALVWRCKLLCYEHGSCIEEPPETVVLQEFPPPNLL